MGFVGQAINKETDWMEELKVVLRSDHCVREELKGNYLVKALRFQFEVVWPVWFGELGVWSESSATPCRPCCLKNAKQ